MPLQSAFQELVFPTHVGVVMNYIPLPVFQEQVSSKI